MLSPHPALYRAPEPRIRTQGVDGAERGKREESVKRKTALQGKCFNVFQLCNVKSCFVTIDSRVLYGIMMEISLEFDVRQIEFTGDNRETHWKTIFYFKRLNTSTKKAFTGIIHTDGVSICVHCRRLKADRPIVPLASPVTKHEENKEAGPATQEVQENDLVVGLDPGSTNILAIAAPKRAEDGTDGKLRQKDMRVFKLSNARYYRESGTMNARKKTETWNSGMKEHLEAMSEVTSRGADFTAFGNSWKFVLLIGRRCGRSIQSPCELVCV